MKPEWLSTQSTSLWILPWTTYSIISIKPVSIIIINQSINNQLIITSKTTFGRWTKGREQICLNVCTVASAFVWTPPFCVKRLSGPLTTTTFSANRPAVLEIWKRGAQVRTFSCTPPFTFVKRQANESLITSQISVQSFHPFPRYEKGVCTCRCAPPLTSVKAWLMGL